MSENKKRILKTVAIVAPLFVIALLAVLYAVTKAFFWNAALHVIVRLFVVLVVTRTLVGAFGDQITKSMTRASVLSGAVLFIDLVAVDAVRYILSGGVYSILFLPACLPLCFMIVVHYSVKDTGRKGSRERLISYLVGIPLLLISLYLEVLSFIQM